MKKLLVSSAVALALHGPSTFAQSWVNAGEGDWTVGANWSGGTVPDGSAAVYVDNGGTAVLDNAAGDTSEFRAGDTSDGNLILRNGAVLETFNSRIAMGPGSRGSAVLSGAGTQWNPTATLAAGYSGHGTLHASAGASITVPGSIVIAYDSTAVGDVVLTGPGTRLSGGNNVYVGRAGNGSLQVSDGAQVEYSPAGISRFLSLGELAGSSGTFNLDGAGTSLAIVTDSFPDFVVGREGSGTLAISNGAQVVFQRASQQAIFMTGSIEVAGIAGSTGTLSLDGSGTRFDALGVNLLVGIRGDGSLSITDGAVMDLGDGSAQPTVHLGAAAGSSATLFLDGNGSQLSTTGSLEFAVGGGEADFAITGGAVAESLLGGSMAIGSGISSGVIDGPGSVWRVGYAVWMADAGQAELTLRSGGELEFSGTAILLLTFSNPAGVGTVNLGDGGAPGILDVAEVRAGLGTPTVVFNHNAADFHFSRDGSATGDPVWITGPADVIHRGSGTTIMGHANYTYTGATTVESGTLLVEGNMVSDVTVEAGGTLGGSGQVGALTLLAGGVLAPGTSPGVLNSGTLVLNGTSLLDFELGSPAGTPGVDSDLIEVTGDLTLDGVIDVTALAGFGAGTYRLINYSGTLTDNALDVGILPVGFTATVDVATAGQVDLVVSAVAPPPVGQISGPAPAGGGNITADLGGAGSCSFASGGFVATGSVATPPPAGLVLPYGLFEFALTGCALGETATITLTYPGAVPANAAYWKFGPTLADPVAHWYSLPAIVAGNTLTFSVTDGGSGDSDLVADGNISDPGGAGLMATGAVPTLQTWAMLLLGSLLAWTGFRRRDRREAFQP